MSALSVRDHWEGEEKAHWILAGTGVGSGIIANPLLVSHRLTAEVTADVLCARDARRRTWRDTEDDTRG